MTFIFLHVNNQMVSVSGPQITMSLSLTLKSPCLGLYLCLWPSNHHVCFPFVPRTLSPSRLLFRVSSEPLCSQNKKVVVRYQVAYLWEFDIQVLTVAPSSSSRDQMGAWNVGELAFPIVFLFLDLISTWIPILTRIWLEFFDFLWLCSSSSAPSDCAPVAPPPVIVLQ